jgi:exodeoxyribonuclease VII small subunit
MVMDDDPRTRMAESLLDKLTFEQALAELDKIVRALEDGGVGLEESLARYEQGVGLLKQCYGQLRQAEQRIQLLAGLDEEGKPILKPFDHTATAEAENKEAKRPRKKNDGEIPFE